MIGYIVCVIFGAMLGMALTALLAASDDRSDRHDTDKDQRD